MTNEERAQFQNMLQDVTVIKNTVEELKSAIMGNKYTQDGGLTRRIEDLEEENKQLKKEISTIKESNVKSELYIKIIWALAGAFASGIFGYILQLIFKS